jgi:hypothetical protein
MLSTHENGFDLGSNCPGERETVMFLLQVPDIFQYAEVQLCLVRAGQNFVLSTIVG